MFYWYFAVKNIDNTDNSNIFNLGLRCFFGCSWDLCGEFNLINPSRYVGQKSSKCHQFASFIWCFRNVAFWLSDIIYWHDSLWFSASDSSLSSDSWLYLDILDGSKTHYYVLVVSLLTDWELTEQSDVISSASF